MTTTDPLAELRAKLAAGASPNVAAPAGTAPAPVPVATKAKAADALEKVELTGEHVFQRLRYFENLVEHQAAHIKTLGALCSRSGTAVPVMPHFKPLKSPAGDFDPNVG